MLRGVSSVPANVQAGISRVLWTLTGANMNATTDQAFTKVGTFTSFMLEAIIATNASTSLTTAVGGIYPATAKGGTAIVANTQVYSALVAPADQVPLTIADTDIRSNAATYLSLTTPQGAPATADLYIIGIALT